VCEDDFAGYRIAVIMALQIPPIATMSAKALNWRVMTVSMLSSPAKSGFGEQRNRKGS
jgi:hypothetical protein